MNKICVSVIVPAYNASATIGKTLEALSRQICTQPYEVIVVDDGSSDDTAKIVGSFPAVRYIFQKNAGPAAARNHGAALAQGEYLAFTDSDCLAHEDWIARLMSGFDQGEIGVVAGSYGIANKKSRLSRCIYQEILWRHNRLMPDFPNAFGSYNFCIRKEVFDAVGGFNTVYRRASGEDNDLSYKIVRFGPRILFQRQALVDHYHPTRVVKYLKEQFHHGYWRLKMYKDHPSMLLGDGYTFWKDIIEMPWVVVSLACLVLNLETGILILSSFLVFEMIWGLLIAGSLFDGIFLGFVFWGRAFARFLGFATGFFNFR